MLRCLIGDLVAAATVVAAADPPERSRLAQGLIEQADAAHRFAKRLGRAHPDWGNGSLMSRALLVPQQKSSPQDSEDFLWSLAMVAGLVAKRKMQPALNSSVI